MRSTIFRRSLLAAALACFGATAGSAASEQPQVLHIRLDDVIHAMSAEYILGGIEHAREIEAEAVLLELRTPGGWSTDMRAIVDGITTSKVPVVVYVSPQGSHAASAGFYILMAADIAAMAPGTTTGASSPVSASGQEFPETMKKKVFEDSAAYLRSFTVKRGRNPELAELAVTEAKAFTDEEALREGLIEVVARDWQDLAGQIDDKVIKRFDGEEQTLRLAGAELIPWEMTFRQKFLSELGDPNLAFLLLVLGAAGLYMEFNSPGLIFPGVVGGICLLMALLAYPILPINFVAVLLILLGIAFFVLEAKFTSHGVLALGGVVSMMIGAITLVKSPPIPELQVHWGVALGVTLPLAAITIFLLRSIMSSFQWHVSTGAEDLVGALGEVRQDIQAGQKGMVLVAGELWRAVSSHALAPPSRVRVVGMKGLLLEVEPERDNGAVEAAGEE